MTPAAIIEKIIDIQNKAEYEKLKTFVASDFVMKMSGGLVINGPDELQQNFEMRRVAFPDQQATIDEVFASEAKAAVRVTVRGTHTGPLQDIPPSGNKIEIPYTAIAHFDDGKLARLYVVIDRLEYMMQLGVIPRPD